MNSFSIRAARPYEVLIERGLLTQAGAQLLKVHAPCKIAVITDDVVDKLYGDGVSASFEENGYEVCRFAFPNGEASKQLQTYSDILDFLAQSDMTRGDLVVALGGGVVGDLAGFAAASYLRGVGFVQMPTTYLAAVDSSVGGKTGLNLRAGKNLCGAFYQPIRVLIDSDTFETLPEARFADGIAETIKYGVIADAALFEKMESGIEATHIDEIVARCIQIKAQFVARDEFDYGDRRFLNFGHTFGHAIERCSQYAISHGHAVGIGMLMAAKAAEKWELCDKSVVRRLETVLQRYRLPVTQDYGVEALSSAMLGDKKRNGDTISLILPEKIGVCRIQDVPVSALRGVVADALEGMD